jgi:hypothetical protein
MRPRRTLAAVLAGGIAGLALAADAQPVRIPGTSVTMTAPPGYRASRNPPGLQNAATGSNIVIAELPPQSQADAVAVFASPKTASTRYSSQGIRFTRIEQLTVGDAQVPLAIGGQPLNGREVRKYITLIGGAQSNTRPTLITVSIMPADPLGKSEVEAALRSVVLARVPTLDEKLAQLSFTFRAVAPFRTDDVLAGGVAFLPTFVGADPSAAKPIMTIGRGPTSAAPAETAQESERLIRALPGFKDAQLAEQKAVTFAGGDGYFVAAVAGTLGVRQFVRVLPGGRYIQLFARGEPAALDGVSAQIAEIASSVELSD